MSPSCQRCLGESSPVGVGVEPVAILGMVEDLLDEPLDRLACLNPQLLGDPGLLKPGLVDDVRQGLHTLRAARASEQEERIRDLPVSFPAWIQGDDDLRVGPGRVGDQDPELDAVGEEAQALAGRQQDTLGDPQMAEAIGTPSLRGRIKVFIERRGPDAELVAWPSAVSRRLPPRLEIFPGLNIIGGFELRVAEQLDQGLDDLVPDAERTAARGKLLKVPAVNIPRCDGASSRRLPSFFGSSLRVVSSFSSSKRTNGSGRAGPRNWQSERSRAMVHLRDEHEDAQEDDLGRAKIDEHLEGMGPLLEDPQARHRPRSAGMVAAIGRSRRPPAAPRDR